MVTYSVASWVMLLKVNGASVLMLLLLRSLYIYRHIQTHTHAERITFVHVNCLNKDSVMYIYSA